MGNGCSKKKGPRRKLTLAIVGLDNAGKTVTTKALQGESLQNVAPTIGFSNVDFRFEGHDITLFDLGGGKKIRDIWKNYFGEIYALLFVIDSSDISRMDECKYVLSNLLEHPHIRGKPILILANKQDQQGAFDEIDICEHLNLEELVNIYKCPCRVETCSAILGHGKKIDPAIKKGMGWLVETVDNMWGKLNTRVQKDITEKQERDAIEKAEKREKVRKMREDRERRESKDRKLRGEDDPVSDDEMAVAHGNDPFKRLNVDDLHKKEQQLKAEKRHQKELETQRHRGKKHSDDEDYHPRLNRRSMRQLSDDDDDDSDAEVPHQSVIKSTLSPKDNFASPDHSRLPNLGSSHLGPSPRFGRKLDPLGPVHQNNQRMEADALRNNKSPRPYDLKPMPSLTPRAQGIGAGEEEAEGRIRMKPLAPLAPLEPLDGGNKKKKKARKNQTAPLVGDHGDDVDNYQPKASPFAPRGWNTPPGQRSLLKVSKSPGLETLREPETEKNDDKNMESFSAKWGLDLPDLSPSTRGHLRPNYDSDPDIVT